MCRGALLCLALAVAGCAVAPDVEPPSGPPPPAVTTWTLGPEEVVEYSLRPVARGQPPRLVVVWSVPMPERLGTTVVQTLGLGVESPAPGLTLPLDEERAVLRLGRAPEVIQSVAEASWPPEEGELRLLGWEGDRLHGQVQAAFRDGETLYTVTASF